MEIKEENRKLIMTFIKKISVFLYLLIYIMENFEWFSSLKEILCNLLLTCSGTFLLLEQAKDFTAAVDVGVLLDWETAAAAAASLANLSLTLGGASATFGW